MFQGEGADAPIAFNLDMDRDAARDTFADKGRVRIMEVLTDDAAKSIYRCMANDLAWGISYNEGAAAKHIPREKIAGLTPEARGSLLSDVVNRAAQQFQYAFAEAPLMQDFVAEAENKHAAHRLLEFVNSPAFYQLIGDVTVDDRAFQTELLACCYQPGHFLTVHNDKDPEGRRAYGFFFDFTPQWRPDWGATHMFFEDDNADITEAFNTHFNTLTIYRVPQRYAISYVPPFAKGARFAMNGWVQLPKARS